MCSFFESGLALHKKFLCFCTPLQQLVASSQKLQTFSYFVFKAATIFSHFGFKDALCIKHSLGTFFGVSLAEK